MYIYYSTGSGALFVHKFVVCTHRCGLIRSRIGTQFCRATKLAVKFPSPSCTSTLRLLTSDILKLPSSVVYTCTCTVRCKKVTPLPYPTLPYLATLPYCYLCVPYRTFAHSYYYLWVPYCCCVCYYPLLAVHLHQQLSASARLE